jgi:hypothetical protein
MLIGAAIVVLTVLAALTGGRLRLLAVTRLRWATVAVAGLFAQVVIITIAPGGDADLHQALHVATYALGLAVLVRNRRLPGLPWIATGTALNLAAILANHGVMPASASAMRTAGLDLDPEVFLNSGVVHDPRLWFLGDVFATPAWFPFHNVFSVGDVLIVLGAGLLVHAATGSRLAPRRGPEVAVHRATAEHRLLRLDGAPIAGADRVVLVADGPGGLVVIPPLPADRAPGRPLGFALPARLPAATRLFAVADGRAAELGPA